MISEACLLEGSWYALEQAGRFLHTAVGVYDRGDPATGLALAMFSREEVGRSRILRTLADEVAGGAVLTSKNVNDRCNDHVKKQRQGATGTTIRVTPPSQLADALQVRASSAPGSPDWKAARDKISDAVTSKTKRDPQDRHDMRERALYVDLDVNSQVWSRPCTIAATAARELIQEAAGDYASERDALRDDVIKDNFPNMANARDRMNPVLVLLPAIWPSTEQIG
jgi:AbiV family abortive infection protein